MSGKRIRPGLSPPVAEDAAGEDDILSRKAEILSRFSEDEDMNRILDFDDDGSPEKYQHQQDDYHTIKLSEGLDTLRLQDFGGGSGGVKTLLGGSSIKFSPSDSISTSSPIKKSSKGQRRFLDSGGGGMVEDGRLFEMNDTDVTSELSDAEFEDVDNIFGDQESGIYLKMHDRLNQKKQLLQDQSKVEELELEKLHTTRQQHQAAAKKRRSNSRIRNPNEQQPHERTITFEESSIEDFANGFDNDIEEKMSILPPPMKLKQSLPNLQSFGKNSLNTVKKFKSSMELISEHPKFNTSNHIYRKLNRIPSFYNQETAHPQDEEYVKAQERKLALLSKFKESTKHQKRGNANGNPQEYHQTHLQSNNVHQHLQPIKNNRNATHQYPQHKKRVKHQINLEQYQKQQSQLNIYHGPMKLNSRTQTWEGNDLDLLKFDTLSKPSLITMNDLKGRNIKKEGSKKFLTLAPDIEPSSNEESPMVFDSTNLRWVYPGDEAHTLFNVPDLDDNISPINVNAGGGYVDVLATNSNPSLARLQSPMRGASTFTQRTTSSTTTASTSDGPLISTSGASSSVTGIVPVEEFNLSMKTINRFLKEEAKIKRKVDNWFPSGSKYLICNRHQEWNGDHLWEIRKLVVDE
ncbi:uncharacterized protein KQ657_004742 [Scheffersomyces spartinae]|uniref:Uncharacterized protein n=1 Tax=Scheffersomyces spartinae TaxID=45513 RepID=A0A9P7VAY6_9ASCO|nr:uncharacterized protein KQ657_004742 [Scheffersomyces spartinae]KAG7194527.1 hypothetical protein KQ657_004742 [Scheffersomyces spartinae]